MAEEKNIIDTSAFESFFGDDFTKDKFAKEQQFGRRIYITAWAVEILAASLGLCIAFFMAYDAYTSSSDSKLIGAILGALPFVLIAVIEPTKIPLALGLYKVKHLGWKLLILIALIGLTVVTFETIFTGLERQVTNTTAIVTEGKDEIRAYEDEIVDLNKEKQRIKQLSIPDATKDLDEQIKTLKNSRKGETENARDSLNEATKKIQEEIKGFNARKDEILKASIKRISFLEQQEQKSATRISELREELNAIESGEVDGIDQKLKNIDDIKTLMDKVKNYVTSGETGQIKLAQNMIGVTEDGKRGPNTNRNVDNFLSQQQDKIDDIREEIDTIRKDYKKSRDLNRENKEREINEEENKINKYTEERDELLKQQTKVPEVKELDKKIEKKRDLIAELNRNSKEEQDTDKQQFNIKINSLEEQKSNLTSTISAEKDREKDLDKEITNLNKKITSKKNSLRREAEKNQIYRFAKKYRSFMDRDKNLAEGKKIDILEVSEGDLSFVGFLWFGSIALICATVGTILALISSIMQDPEAFREKQKMIKSTPVRRAIRLLAVALRRRINKPRKVEVPVEVEKIVEIEKEVEKEVEIIKEVIKEVPVDRIVEVEKEIPVEKIALKEVPVEIVRKELVHVPFYATEAGVVDATNVLKNSKIPVQTIEGNNSIETESQIIDVEIKDEVKPNKKGSNEKGREAESTNSKPKAKATKPKTTANKTARAKRTASRKPTPANK